MEHILKTFFEKYDLHPNCVVVGVSTGVDSMVLLTLLQEILPSNAIVVGHINHGKREASVMEEAFIRRYCEEGHLRCYVDYFQENEGNFQEEARLFRLQFFKRIMHEVKASHLFLAHHLNDDMETVFMQMMRGGSLARLAGIQEYYLEDGIALCRPLLETPKQLILEYATQEKIVYYEDASNATDDYTRNWVRHHIVGKIEKEFPDFRTSFLEYKTNLSETADLIRQARDRYIQEFVHSINRGNEWSRSSFLVLPPLLQREVLFELTKNNRLSRAFIDEIRHLIENNKPNHTLAMKDSWFEKEYDVIRIVEQSTQQVPKSILLEELKDYPIDDQWIISLTKKRCNCECNSSIIWYNSSMLPLVARCRQDGDEIEFDYGTKKVKKCFIDQKVGKSFRDLPILLEKDDIILAILGVARSKNLSSLKDCDITIELKETKNESKSLH